MAENAVGSCGVQAERCRLVDLSGFHGTRNRSWQVIADFAEWHAEAMHDLQRSALSGRHRHGLTIEQMVRNQTTTVIAAANFAASSRTTPSTVMLLINAKPTYR